MQLIGYEGFPNFETNLTHDDDIKLMSLGKNNVTSRQEE